MTRSNAFKLCELLALAGCCILPASPCFAIGWAEYGPDAARAALWWVAGLSGAAAVVGLTGQAIIAGRR